MMKSKKIAVFPGSFDPITIGHESIVLRALPLFDEIIVAVGTNQLKQSFFQLEKRLEWIRWTFRDQPSVHTEVYSGLTVDFCKKVNASYILRGLRSSTDFEFERGIGQANKILERDIETVFLLSLAKHLSVTSSIVRDIFRNGGEVISFIPQGIQLTI